jgi:hypothetical protein
MFLHMWMLLYSSRLAASSVNAGTQIANVLGAVGRRVADALACARQHRLARPQLDSALVVLDDDRALEHDRYLVELGRLRGFLPAGRTRHTGDAHRGGPGADVPNQLADHLVADAGHDRRGGHVHRHQERGLRSA